MPDPSEPFINASKANIEASLRLATKSLDGATRLLKHQLDVAKTMMEEGAETMKAALSGDADWNAIAGRTLSYEKQLQKLVELSREYFEVSAQTQTELAHVIEENMEIMNQAVKENLEALSKNVPGAAESEKGKKRA